MLLTQTLAILYPLAFFSVEGPDLLDVYIGKSEAGEGPAGVLATMRHPPWVMD